MKVQVQLSYTYLGAPFVLFWRINASSSFRIPSCRKAHGCSSPFQPTNFLPSVKLALPSAHCISLAPAPGSSHRPRTFFPALHPPRSRAWGGSPAPSLSSLPLAGALGLAHGGTGHAQRRPRGQVCFAGACTRRRAGARLQLELRLLELELPGVPPPTPPSSRAAAGAGVGAASSGQPAPGPAEPCTESRAQRGAAPGEESRRLGLVSRRGTARTQDGCTVGPERGQQAGRQKPGQARGRCGCSYRCSDWGSRARSDAGARGRDPTAGPKE